MQRAVIASYDPDSLMRDLLYSLNRRLDLISTASNFERIVTTCCSQPCKRAGYGPA